MPLKPPPFRLVPFSSSWSCTASHFLRYSSFSHLLTFSTKLSKCKESTWTIRAFKPAFCGLMSQCCPRKTNSHLTAVGVKGFVVGRKWEREIDKDASKALKQSRCVVRMRCVSDNYSIIYSRLHVLCEHLINTIDYSVGCRNCSKTPIKL